MLYEWGIYKAHILFLGCWCGRVVEDRGVPGSAYAKVLARIKKYRRVAIWMAKWRYGGRGACVEWLIIAYTCFILLALYSWGVGAGRGEGVGAGRGEGACGSPPGAWCVYFGHFGLNCTPFSRTHRSVSACLPVCLRSTCLPLLHALPRVLRCWCGCERACELLPHPWPKTILDFGRSEAAGDTLILGVDLHRL
jgi:hypothetical protein